MNNEMYLSDETLNIIIPVVGVLMSGLFAGVISHIMIRRAVHLDAKRDVLARILGHRFFLFDSGGLKGEARPDQEPFIALNQAFVVYSGCSKVIDTLSRLQHAKQPSEKKDVFITLIKEMAKAAKVSRDLSDMNDSFFEESFIPET